MPGKISEPDGNLKSSAFDATFSFDRTAAALKLIEPFLVLGLRRFGNCHSNVIPMRTTRRIWEAEAHHGHVSGHGEGPRGSSNFRILQPKSFYTQVFAGMRRRRTLCSSSLGTFPTLVCFEHEPIAFVVERHRENGRGRESVLRSSATCFFYQSGIH